MWIGHDNFKEFIKDAWKDNSDLNLMLDDLKNSLVGIRMFLGLWKRGKILFLLVYKMELNNLLPTLSLLSYVNWSVSFRKFLSKRFNGFKNLGQHG